jgi:hypothetical protein
MLKYKGFLIEPFETEPAGVQRSPVLITERSRPFLTAKNAISSGLVALKPFRLKRRSKSPCGSSMVEE